MIGGRNNIAWIVCVDSTPVSAWFDSYAKALAAMEVIIAEKCNGSGYVVSRFKSESVTHALSDYVHLDKDGVLMHVITISGSPF